MEQREEFFIVTDHCCKIKDTETLFQQFFDGDSNGSSDPNDSGDPNGSGGSETIINKKKELELFLLEKDWSVWKETTISQKTKMAKKEQTILQQLVFTNYAAGIWGTVNFFEEPFYSFSSSFCNNLQKNDKEKTTIKPKTTKTKIKEKRMVLSVFRENVQPRWEDKENEGGGRFYFRMSLPKQAWELFCLLVADAVSESFSSECMDESLQQKLNGVSLNFSSCVVTVWHSKEMPAYQAEMCIDYVKYIFGKSTNEKNMIVDSFWRKT